MGYGVRETRPTGVTLAKQKPARSSAALKHTVPAAELRWRCDPKSIAAHRERPNDENDLIGQARALDALRLGLTLESPGYNIFVCGSSGTGKMSTVRALLANRPSRQRALNDYAYVHNFSDPDRPSLLRMPAGEAKRFRKELEKVVHDLPDIVSRVLDSEQVERRRERLAESYKQLEREAIGEFETTCTKRGFQIAQIQVGEMQQLEIYPLHRKKPVDIDELRELAATGKARVPNIEEIVTAHEGLEAELRAILLHLRKEARRMHGEIRTLESDAVTAALRDTFADVVEQHPYDGISRWLDGVTTAIIDNLDAFEEQEEGESGRERQGHLDDLVRRLGINIVLDNEGATGTPVVFENFPSFTNLLGTVERPTDDTRGTVDFTHIKAGSLLRADGGFLVLNANDAASEAGVWRFMCRVLKTRELEIQSPEQAMAPGQSSALKPESIRVDVKVIAVGDDELFRLLYSNTDEFRRVFKIKADFDDEMPRDDRHIGLYAHHAWRVQREESLVPVSDEALGRLVEHGIRLADRQDRLSARFSDLTDVLREAAHYARVSGADLVLAGHVDKALAERRRRHGLAEEKLHELIRCGLVDIATDGEELGAINALTVLDMADHAFGQPCRVTASVAPGTDGVISIEREVELSGRLHDKGTMILVAWMRARYMPDQPMCLSAAVTFEQLHDELDGDSASAAEALALLSALAGVPIPQGIAITGAIDQRGNIHAIGGLNEKVEGFYRLCVFRGLTGRQGVILPHDNRRNLQLEPEVVDAVASGRFHIWSVQHLDEAIELLTGAPAGAPDAAGRFKADSFNGRVCTRLAELAILADPQSRRAEPKTTRSKRAATHVHDE